MKIFIFLLVQLFSYTLIFSQSNGSVYVDCYHPYYSGSFQENFQCMNFYYPCCYWLNLGYDKMESKGIDKNDLILISGTSANNCWGFAYWVSEGGSNAVIGTDYTVEYLLVCGKYLFITNQQEYTGRIKNYYNGGGMVHSAICTNYTLNNKKMYLQCWGETAPVVLSSEQAYKDWVGAPNQGFSTNLYDSTNLYERRAITSNGIQLTANTANMNSAGSNFEFEVELEYPTTADDNPPFILYVEWTLELRTEATNENLIFKHISRPWTGTEERLQTISWQPELPDVSTCSNEWELKNDCKAQGELSVMLIGSRGMVYDIDNEGDAKIKFDIDIEEYNFFHNKEREEFYNLNANNFLPLKEYYYAIDNITAGDIEISSNMEFVAGNSIDLNNGFETADNIDFTAYIKTCACESYGSNLKKSYKQGELINEIFEENKKIEETQNQKPDILSEKFSLSLYPNPANNILNLSINNAKTENLNIIIIDLQGKVWYAGNSTKAESEINISTLPAGLYIVQVVLKEKVMQQKFIKN